MLYYFNSIKVRLEPDSLFLMPEVSANFNSIKVRLEPEGYTTYPEENPFQFHKGTIRTS